MNIEDRMLTALLAGIAEQRAGHPEPRPFDATNAGRIALQLHHHHQHHQHHHYMPAEHLTHYIPVLHSLYLAQWRHNNERRLAYTHIAEQAAVFYNDPGDRSSLLREVQQLLGPVLLCLLKNAMNEGTLAVQKKQYRLDFQTIQKSTAVAEGVWCTACLVGDRECVFGDLDEAGRTVFKDMQPLDRRILKDLLDLMNQERANQYHLTFQPYTMQTDSCTSNDSIVTLYKRHRVELPGRTCLLGKFRPLESETALCDLHFEFLGQNSFVTAVADHTTPLKTVILKAYEAVSGGGGIKIEKLYRETVEVMCEIGNGLVAEEEMKHKEASQSSSGSTVYRLCKLKEEIVNLDGTIQDASLKSGDCLIVVALNASAREFIPSAMKLWSH